MDHFKQFEYKLQIKEQHLDTFGHVNNATYLALLEEARWELLETHGFGLKKIQALQMGPIVLACQIQFLKELILREWVVIESQVLSYEKKIATMRQDIRDKAGCVRASAQLTFGFFDFNTRKLILPSAEWLIAIGSHV